MIPNYESKSNPNRNAAVAKPMRRSIWGVVLLLLFIAFQGVRIYSAYHRGPSKAEREAKMQQATDRVIADFAKQQWDAHMQESQRIADQEVEKVLAAMRARANAAATPPKPATAAVER